MSVPLVLSFVVRYVLWLFFPTTGRAMVADGSVGSGSSYTGFPVA